MTKVPGLRLRGKRYYFEVRHERLRGGRMVMSLRTADLRLAIERRQAVVTLMDRGDWGLMDRLRSDDLHITDLVAAVRNGEVQGLRRTGHAPTLLGDAVDQYLQRTEATASGRTHTTYRSLCKTLLAHFGADYPMEDLTIEAAERFLHGEKKRAEGEVWSPNSQKSARWTYAALWNLAIERDAERAAKAGLDPILTLNPWRKAHVPEARATRAVFLSPPEWVTLVRSIRGTPPMALLGLAFRAGLRRAEILHLRTDIDLILEGPDPTVRIQSRGGEWAWKPKTANSERDVPLTPDLVELLQEHKANGFSGDRYFIRPAAEDRPISFSTADKWTRASYESVGIRYGRRGDALTLHSGRHTYASWLAQAGEPLNIVADLLGDTMEMVYQTYAHLVPNTLRKSAMVGYQMVLEAGLNEGS